MTDDGISVVILREADWEYAYKVGKLFDTAARMGQLLGGMENPAHIVECVDCPLCQAPPGSHCRTLTGGTVTRRPHKTRMVLLMAVFHALSTEIVIQEEEQIEDYL